MNDSRQVNDVWMRCSEPQRQPSIVVFYILLKFHEFQAPAYFRPPKTRKSQSLPYHSNSVKYELPSQKTKCYFSIYHQTKKAFSTDSLRVVIATSVQVNFLTGLLFSPVCNISSVNMFCPVPLSQCLTVFQSRKLVAVQKM